MFRRLRVNHDFFMDRILEDYNTGFGISNEEMYWLGLDRIYSFTQRGPIVLRVEAMTFDVDDWFGEYDGFKLTKNNTTKKYTAEYSAYRSNCELMDAFIK